MSETSTDGAAASKIPPPSYLNLQAGDIFPWLMQDVTTKAQFALDTLAGRYQLYCFFMAAQDEPGRAALKAVMERAYLFDDLKCSFVGVSVNAKDRADGLGDRLPGVRIAWDFDLAVSKACGAAHREAQPGDGAPLRRFWVLVDPSLHVLQVFPFAADPHAVLDAVQALPEPNLFGGVRRPPPVLILPNVLEPDLCRRLIDLYDSQGGSDSGVHRGGQGVMHKAFKSRKDCAIEEKGLLDLLTQRLLRRVTPELEKLFFCKAHYIERFLIGCYAAEEGGHFGPHRDNRPGLTAHRRFAVSVNLNDDFEGGEVAFPEYSTQGYKAPAGWAVVFPCAILHRVTPVTAGARYAFLPFMFDDSGKAIFHEERARITTAA
jgi:predicted 2-oxoglutarate/Fe(II)-dependent dioxygenase YbiX/peroxiredoxin